jgi:hypothetical protein
MGGAEWRKEEKELCLLSPNKVAFTAEYIKKFGQPGKLSRLDNIWAARHQIKEELVPVRPPGTVTEPRKDKPWADVDEGKVLADISNKLSELIQIQKETYSLFEYLDKRKDKDGTSENVSVPGS